MRHIQPRSPSRSREAGAHTLYLDAAPQRRPRQQAPTRPPGLVHWAALIARTATAAAVFANSQGLSCLPVTRTESVRSSRKPTVTLQPPSLGELVPTPCTAG